MRSIPPISKFHTLLHNGATKIREISFDFSFPQFFLQTISFFKSVPWNWLMVNNKISYEFKKFLAPLGPVSLSGNKAHNGAKDFFGSVSKMATVVSSLD